MQKTNDKLINEMLKKWVSGDLSVENELFNELYPLLRTVVHSEHSKINDKEMNTTLLANEVYLNLKQNKNLLINDKRHLLATAARMVRYMLIDNVRSKLSIKKGGMQKRVTLQHPDFANNTPEISVDWLTLHHLLQELEMVDPEATRLIELRFFAGLNIDETASLMNTSNSTVSRNWQFARTWLLNKLNK